MADLHMTYFLVMGSLVLSVLFTVAWALSAMLRWLAAGLPMRRGGAPGKAAKKTAKRTTRKPAPRKADNNRAAGKAASGRAAASKAAEPPRHPWRLTRRLAEWRASMPLAIVAALIYLVARLAAHGMSFRPPYAAPDGFHDLLVGLGWLSAGLIVVALLHRLAAWRCR